MARQIVLRSRAHLGRLATAVTILGLVTLISAPADAQSRRVNSQSISCDQVRTMISKQGAVIMNTGRNTFDRYVSNRSFCQVNEVAKSDFIPTKDNAKCPVRRCGTVAPFGFNR